MTSTEDTNETLVDQALGPHSVALLGRSSGKYPDANGLLVQGDEETALIEPTPGVWQRLDSGQLAADVVDLVLLSHAHEDHITGLALLDDLPVWVHERDHAAMHDLDAFIDQYGLPDDVAAEFRVQVIDQFRFVPRPDSIAFADGHQWDLGGGVRVRAIHSPGHTPGHCFFWVEPDRVLYLGDLDLSSFGPFYGDRASSADAFEETIERTRQLALELEPTWCVTGHHKAVVAGEDFLPALEKYAAVIPRRDQRVLDLLAEGPLTAEQIAERRIVYRPQSQGLFIEHVERLSTAMHLRRLQQQGAVEHLENGRFQTT